MHDDLGFTQQDLSWVFNAHVVAFGGLLLLCGRLSDLFGARSYDDTAGGPTLPLSSDLHASGGRCFMRRPHAEEIGTVGCRIRKRS